MRFIQSLSFLKQPSGALRWLGQHSLMLMCIHAFEDSSFSFWLRMAPSLGVLTRLLADILVLVIIVKLKSLIVQHNGER